MGQFELNMPDLLEVADKAEEIAKQASLDASRTWDEFVASDPVGQIQEQANGFASSAWDNAQAVAGDDIAETGKNVAYLSGRGALGTAGFFENAVETGNVWIQSALGRRDAAENDLRHSFTEDLADQWTAYMEVDDKVEQIGDSVESAGEVVGAIGTAAAATAAIASTAVPLGVGVAATGVASLGVAGESLDKNFAEDGELSDAALVESGLVAAGTAASIAIPGGIARHAAAKTEAAASSIITAESSLAPNETTVIDGVKHYADDAGNVFRVGDDLVPSCEYRINGYEYRTDFQGRIESASGQLQLKDHVGRKPMPDSIQAIGKGNEALGDQRGHLIADMFNGSGGLENLVPQGAEVNMRTIKAIEDRCADALSEGAEVFYKVEPRYSGNSYRPDSFVVADIIDGETTITVVKNLIGG